MKEVRLKRGSAEWHARFERIREMKRAGMSNAEIGHELGISEKYASLLVTEAGAATRPHDPVTMGEVKAVAEMRRRGMMAGEIATALGCKQARVNHIVGYYPEYFADSGIHARHRRIVELHRLGWDNKRIAREMGVTVRTVRHHLKQEEAEHGDD